MIACSQFDFELDQLMVKDKMQPLLLCSVFEEIDCGLMSQFTELNGFTAILKRI